MFFKSIGALLILSAIASAQDIKTLYEQGQYTQCLEEVKEADLSESKTHWYWGLCAEALGKDEVAVSAYERVLILEENNIEATIALAKLYSALQMPSLSKVLLKNVQASQLSPSDKNTLAALLSESNVLTQFKARVNADLGYDTNVNISPGSNVLNAGGVSSDEKGSAFTQLSVQLSYLHDLEEQEQWYIKTEADIYQKNNFSEHLYDVISGRLSFGPGYKGEGFTLDLPVYYERVNYLDKDLLQEYGFRPELSFLITKKFILNLNLLYAKQDYLDSSDSLRDNKTLGGGIGGIYFMGTDYVYARFNYEDIQAENSLPSLYTDKSFMDLKMGAYLHYSLVDLELSYLYRNAEYDDIAIGKNESRSDDFNEFVIGLGRNLSQHFRLNLNYNHTSNDSNYILAQYDKDVLYFGLEYNY